jgi:hypothetical protein
MPNFNLSQQPHYPIKTIDTDEPILSSQLIPLFTNDNGITLCVRSKSGHPQRGGYFFCITKESEDLYILETIEGVEVDTFDLPSLISFINHASGKKFNAQLLDYCQNSINFRND